MKYARQRKAKQERQELDARIAAYAKLHPNLSQREIGEVFAVSGTRIGQALRRQQ